MLRDLAVELLFRASILQISSDLLDPSQIPPFSHQEALPAEFQALVHAINQRAYDFPVSTFFANDKILSGVDLRLSERNKMQSMLSSIEHKNRRYYTTAAVVSSSNSALERELIHSQISSGAVLVDRYRAKDSSSYNHHHNHRDEL